MHQHQLVVAHAVLYRYCTTISSMRLLSCAVLVPLQNKPYFTSMSPMSCPPPFSQYRLDPLSFSLLYFKGSIRTQQGRLSAPKVRSSTSRGTEQGVHSMVLLAGTATIMMVRKNNKISQKQKIMITCSLKFYPRSTRSLRVNRST